MVFVCVCLIYAALMCTSINAGADAENTLISFLYKIPLL